MNPFVQGNKNDFNDAQAICEAASRPSMRFVTPRNEAQQTLSALHRVREGLVRQRTAATNQIHAFLCGRSASKDNSYARDIACYKRHTKLTDDGIA